MFYPHSGRGCTSGWNMVLRAIEVRFEKLDASLRDMATELRRLGRETGEQCQGTKALKAELASACQGTEALKALVADVSQGTEALKANVANACQGTETLRVDSCKNWSKPETRVGRLEAEMEASRVARQEGSAEMAQRNCA